jgi:hypothetical protein
MAFQVCPASQVPEGPVVEHRHLLVTLVNNMKTCPIVPLV